MEIKLSLKDVVGLYKFYKDHNEDEAFPNHFPSEKKRRGRLLRLGLLNEQGSLNRLRGKMAIEKLLEKIEIYKEGVPWDDYFKKHNNKEWRTSHMIMQINHIPWIEVEVDCQVRKYRAKEHYIYMTNKEIIIAGKPIRNKKPEQSMKLDRLAVTDGWADFIKNRIREYVDYKEQWVEVKPHTFCWDVTGRNELVWFTDVNQELWLPIKGQYLKFILRRFSRRLSFFMNPHTKEGFLAVVSPPQKSILMYQYMAACVLPLDEIGKFHIPNTKIIGWEGKFDGKRRLV